MSQKFNTEVIPSYDKMTDEQKEFYDDTIRSLIQSNSAALDNAADSPFDTVEQLNQGSSLLESILSGTLPTNHSGSLLDMEGRASSVRMMEVS